MVICFYILFTDSKSTETLKYLWTENPITLAKGIEFPQFSLTETVPFNCEKEYYGSEYYSYACTVKSRYLEVDGTIFYKFKLPEVQINLYFG